MASILDQYMQASAGENLNPFLGPDVTEPVNEISTIYCFLRTLSSTFTEIFFLGDCLVHFGLSFEKRQLRISLCTAAPSLLLTLVCRHLGSAEINNEFFMYLHPPELKNFLDLNRIR